MPLAISERRYQEIRRRVAEAQLQRQVTEIMAAPGEMTFESVDAFFEHLDAVVERFENRPARPRNKDQ
jgi:hypothetical protein